MQRKPAEVSTDMSKDVCTHTLYSKYLAVYQKKYKKAEQMQKETG